MIYNKLRADIGVVIPKTENVAEHHLDIGGSSHPKQRLEQRLDVVMSKISPIVGTFTKVLIEEICPLVILDITL